MKKVSAKKYYEYFEDNVYRHEGVLHKTDFTRCHPFRVAFRSLKWVDKFL